MEEESHVSNNLFIRLAFGYVCGSRFKLLIKVSGGEQPTVGGTIPQVGGPGLHKKAS